MERYPLRYSGRRRRRSRKWAYIVSVLLVLLAMKIFIRGSNPTSVVGDVDEFSVFTNSIQTENSEVLTAPRPISELNLDEIPISLSKSNPELTAVIDDVMACIDAEPPRIIAARNRLNEVLSMPMSRQQLAFVKKQLSKLSEQWLFSRTVFPEDTLCGSYKVKLADQFIKLGKRFKVPYEILMRINKISDAKALRAGDTIKVINGPFHCKIYRSAFTMDLYLQDTFIRSFSVGLGKPGTETPTGCWAVKPNGKLISPTWTDPTTGKTYEAENPNYPLGARWIGLEGIKGAAKDRTGFAIHGTKKTDEIGTAGSQGCIRLYNDDVILLYDLLMPGVSQDIVVKP